MSNAMVLQLIEVVGEMNADEQRVVLEIAKRIRAGREQYGPLDVASDPRNFTREGKFEVLDLCAYMAMRLQKEENDGRS